MDAPQRSTDIRVRCADGASLADLVAAVERRGLTVELSEPAGLVGDAVQTVYRALVCDPRGGSEPVAVGVSRRGYLGALAVEFAEMLGRSGRDECSPGVGWGRRTAA